MTNIAETQKKTLLFFSSQDLSFGYSFLRFKLEQNIVQNVNNHLS